MDEEVLAAAEGRGSEKETGKRKNAGKLPGKNAEGSAEKAIKFSPEVGHPIHEAIREAKRRGIKDFEPGEMILEALKQVAPDWWMNYLEEITPLEYKVSQALVDPALRDKLTSLLASQKFN